MTSLKRMLAGCGAVLLCGMAYTVATAQGFYNHKTYFTFSRSVELPGGITLEPGKYVFRLADSSANRYIVQVLNEHETRIFATMLAVEPSDEAVIMFGETPANAPQPIRYWYHSGRTVGPIGYELVYPKDQATRIANATNQHVLMTDAPVNEAHAMTQAQVRTMDPNGTTAEYRENVRSPQVHSTSPAATTGQQRMPAREGFDAARAELPEVAGIQSLTLIGLTLLGSALFALRVHYRASPLPLERLDARGRYKQPSRSDTS